MRSRVVKPVLATSLLAAAASGAGAAVLEEVVVTAQLREQSLQDVPVSVSAMSGEKMMEAGIGKIEDLQAYVPNLYMSESQLSTNIFVRGLGSGDNQGFEQSVGMYVDGIYYGKAQLGRAPFLDLERVEVLRGPQNILYGKNSIAGAVNITTARSSDEFTGSVALTYEPEYEDRVADIVFSGPINDALGYRFAARVRDSDGYMDNLLLGNTAPQREEQTLRLRFDWEVSDDLSAMLKLETGSFDTVGRHAEVILALPSEATGAAALVWQERTYLEILDNTNVPLLLTLDADSSINNPLRDHQNSRQHEESETDTYNATVKLDYYVDGHTFTAITGYMAYEFYDLCDCDDVGAPLFGAEFFEDYWQFSQEVRWVSPVGERFEYIAGAYFQMSEFEFHDTILIDSDFEQQILNFGDLATGGSFGDVEDGIGDAGDEIVGQRSPRDFITDSTMWSTFFQGTWNVTDSFRATAGVRYTDETKEGRRKLDFAKADGTIDPRGSEVDTVLAIVFKAERHDLKGERREQQFSPLLSFQYDISADAMLYGLASKGFKSGGYDARSNATPDPNDIANPHAAANKQQRIIGSFEYEEEEAVNYELGLKSTLFNGAAELNVAVFRTEYDDLQVSIFDGGVGFNVGNAASAVSQGLELDGRLAITEHLMLAGGLALLDFEFEEFPNGTCAQGQAPTNPNGIHCDKSGETNQYAADWSGNLALIYSRPISDNLEFKANLDVVAIDDYNPSANVDPRMDEDGYYKLNGRIALGDLDDTWEVALLGKNLTDEYIIAYSADVPTAYTVTQAPTYFGFAESPRTIALQLSYSW